MGYACFSLEAVAGRRMPPQSLVYRILGPEIIMTTFVLHTKTTAPLGSRECLTAIERRFGFIPNVFAVQAESPAMLEGFQTLLGAFGKTAFSVTEREIVLITASIENGCTFCVAAHTASAKKQGVSSAVIESLREGKSLGEAKLDALRRFARAVVMGRGAVCRTETEAFLKAGYDNRAILEVIMGVALMVMSNYANRFANTPLNDTLEPFVWTCPEDHGRGGDR